MKIYVLAVHPICSDAELIIRRFKTELTRLDMFFASKSRAIYETTHRKSTIKFCPATKKV
jgi:ribosomal protein S21